MFDDSSDGLDSYDVGILSALEEDADLTTVELSKRVHLSRTAVARRIQGLRDRGVIGPSRTTLRYDRLGFGVRAYVEMSAPGIDTFEIRDRVLERPEVLSVSIVVGEPLMIVDVITLNTAHLHQFLTWVNDRGISSTKVVLKRHESHMPLKERLRRIEELRRKPDARLMEHID